MKNLISYKKISELKLQKLTLKSLGKLKSYKIGIINFDRSRLRYELRKIKKISFTDAYSEYAVGKWQSCSLANKSGNFEDGLSYEYNDCAKKTKIAKLIPYLISKIEETFEWKHIRSIRIFSSKNNGMIIPHKDYLDLEKGFTRFHIPIQTDKLCFNSENNFVYNMNIGEIWFLDARQPHGAGSFSKTGKLSVVIDFNPEIDMKSLFKIENVFQPDFNISVICREEIDKSFHQEVINLCKKINMGNFNEVLKNLTQVHFFKKVNCTKIYDWLDDICKLSGNNDLKLKSNSIRKYFLGG